MDTNIENAMEANNDRLLERIERVIDDKMSRKSTPKFDFKKKSNEKQFELNTAVAQHLTRADKCLVQVSSQVDTGIPSEHLKRASDEIDAALESIHQRNKMIKLADMSPAGWAAVSEYECHQLAEDSDDEKRIVKAESRALRKIKEAQKKRTSSYRGRGFRGGGNGNAASTATSGLHGGQSTQPSLGTARLGVCYTCGKPGHYRFECAVMKKAMSDGGQKPEASKLSIYNMSNIYAKQVNQCDSKCVNPIVKENNNCQSPIGRLNSSVKHWNDTDANPFVMDVISSGYKLPLRYEPKSVTLRNNLSSVNHSVFVDTEISNLLRKKCISQVKFVPTVVNPLTVADNSRSKLRLVLDCRHINLFLHKFKFAYENEATAKILFKKGDFAFHFDLMAAYHHIEIFHEHRRYLGFFWRSNYYVFNVLPFGLATAGFVFTEVTRHLVTIWREKGYRVIMYLDDGVAASDNVNDANEMARQIRNDLNNFGFLISEEKSDWNPKTSVIWLGFNFDFLSGRISVSQDRLNRIICKIDQLLERCKSKVAFCKVRDLASAVGSIQSAQAAVGNATIVMTKFCHICIDQRFNWQSNIMLSDRAVNELQFWKNSIQNLNGKLLCDNKIVSCIIYSDASEAGYGGYVTMDDEVQTEASGAWSVSDSSESSTWRELQAVSLLLNKFARTLMGKCVQWNTDNKNVVTIMNKGSMKPKLQCIALNIFDIIGQFDIELIMQWVPREQNEQADFLSKALFGGQDEWEISRKFFNILNGIWGPFTVDRFANEQNAKCIRFNSEKWAPGAEAINSMSVSWKHELNWWVPPPKNGMAVVKKIVEEKASGVLILPVWRSAPYWPLLFPNGQQADFIVNIKYFVSDRNIFVTVGRTKRGIFGNKKYNVKMMALCVRFM